MDDISLALNPPRFAKKRRKPPIQFARSASAVWPLAALNGREPVVLDPGCAKPRGIELAYARTDASDAVTSCPIGTQNGTATHLMPPMTPALSVDDGEIMFAGRHGHGYAIIINHNNGWASYYVNLDAIIAIRTDLYRPRAQHVRSGDTIGYVGAPTTGAFKRLYFELWQLDSARQFIPVDPRSRFKDWKLVQHHDHVMPAPPIAREEAA